MPRSSDLCSSFMSLTVPLSGTIGAFRLRRQGRRCSLRAGGTTALTRTAIVRAYDRASAVLAAAMSAFAIYVAAFGVFDNVIVSGLTVLLARRLRVLRLAQARTASPTATWMLVMHGLLALAMTGPGPRLGQADVRAGVPIRRHQPDAGHPRLDRLRADLLHDLPLLRHTDAAGHRARPASTCLRRPASAAATRTGRALPKISGSRPTALSAGRSKSSAASSSSISCSAPCLQAAGAGEVLLKIAFAATGRLAGGPGACGDRRLRAVRHDVGRGGRQCRVDRRVHDPRHQEGRLLGRALPAASRRRPRPAVRSCRRSWARSPS